MSELNPSQKSTVFCGIDVSAASLAIAVHQDEQRVFNNDASGHKTLISWLRKRKALVRVAMEATGIYSLDLAIALDRADGIEVAVLNPKMVSHFARTLRRSKTDSADAQSLAEYSRRMPFTPWCAPTLNSLQLRTISRHLLGLTAEYTRQNNHPAVSPRSKGADPKR